MPVFTANLPGELKVGDRIEIGGKIKDNAKKMSVNLCAQEGEEPRDVVLHFDVRFHRDNIISLSRKNGVWIGSGNYDTNYNMFVPGTIFRIVFEVKDPYVITIYCQGKFHSNFLPKIPLSMARYLVAWADVEKITHCYFFMGEKLAEVTSGEVSPPPPYQCPSAVASAIPKTTTTALLAEPNKRVTRQRSPPPNAVQSPTESSSQGYQQYEGAGPKYFYETMGCNCAQETCQERHLRVASLPRTYRQDKDESSTSNISAQTTSSTLETEVYVPKMEMKRRFRRNNFPLSQMVNFMNKSKRH